MTPGRGVFIGQRKDRMGARLLMLLTCIRLAEDFDTDYRVNWFPQGADAPELEHPQELFSQAWMADHFLDTDAFEALSQKAQPIWKFQNDKTPDRLIKHLDAGRAVLVEEGFQILAFPWEDIETIRPRYREFINRIGFTDEIRAIMDRADQALSGQGVSAYHIRRGDILNGLPWKHSTWPAKIETEELYEAHLDKFADNPAIMFSDQPELITRFQKRYPQLMRMSDIADLSEKTRAKRDFLELYAMSRADQVVAPPVSAFSMAAARLSGQENKMFRDVLSPQEISEANEKTVDRLRKGANGFINASEAAHIYAKATFHLFSLQAEDRAEESRQFAESLLEAGADNAFLPLLNALNYFYLRRWKEALRLTEQTLENPHIWPEDHAVACALQAAILGSQKKRWLAAQAFSRAFWAKPSRPDVIIFGSRLVFRDQVAYRAMPPVDWTIQKAVRRSWFNFNAHVAQRRVLSRLPCNFDVILLDWSDLALDQKARRLNSSRDRLVLLQDWLGNMQNLSEKMQVPLDSPEYQSFSTILRYRLDDLPLEKAIDVSRNVSSLRPENTLYLKRLAELYEADGDYSQARLKMAEAVGNDPGNPFLVFAMGGLLERIGASEQGQNQILEAAELDDNTAAIQGAAGQLLLRRGDKKKAAGYLRKARDLCPPYKRFANQLKRTET